MVESQHAAILEVHLVEPERELWAGDADFVVARTKEGDIGVLPGHEPTFALLSIGEVRIERTDQPTFLAAIDGGFLSVSSAIDGKTRVDVLGDNVTLPTEVNPVHVAALREDAAKLAESGKTSEAMERSQKAEVLERLPDE